jgi:hypothetical protein
MYKDLLPSRVYVELPSGKWLLPGQSAACPGPTPTGNCPVARPGAVRPCTRGVWFVPGEHGWRAEDVPDDGPCPLAWLDPLGPAPVPLD